jgi:hypothetical protein
MAIHKANDKAVAYSSFPSVKLWDDSSEMLDIPVEELPYIRKDVFKRRYDNSNEFFSGVLDPAIIFFISTGEEKQISSKEIKGIEKFTYLRQHIFRSQMVGELYAQNQFGIMTLLLTKVKCYEIKRPKSEITPENMVAVVHGIIEKTIP